jgi:hypothetical protein
MKETRLKKDRSKMVLIIQSTKDDQKVGELFLQIARNESVSFEEYEVFQVPSPVYTFKEEFIEHIAKHGLSSLVNSDLILEHIVPKGSGLNSTVPILHKYLNKVGIDNELIIVDPYFFSNSSNSNHSNEVVSILSPYLSSLQDLYIVTNSNSTNNSIKTDIISGICAINSSINIHHNTSNDYHDRFWISNNREKGMITGTSLNGFGNRLALIDRLNTSDVRDIIQNLKNDGLIS